MAKSAKQTTTTPHLISGSTYGVAIPVIVNFDTGVPKEARAGVQRRLLVSTDPPQPGVWHRVADGKQVYISLAGYDIPAVRRPSSAHSGY